MSHNTKIEFAVKDWELLEEVAKSIGATITIGENLVVNMYSGNEVTNARAKVHLPGWKYPMAITKEGELIYDHWGSKANTMTQLVKLRNEYTLKATEKVARKRRQRVKRRTFESKPNWRFVEVMC